MSKAKTKTTKLLYDGKDQAKIIKARIIEFTGWDSMVHDYAHAKKVLNEKPIAYKITITVEELE